VFPPSGDFWKYSLIPQAIANGLSSILVLFFLLSNLHGGLLDIGLVAGVSALALIPSQMLWGWLIDGTGRCKPFLVFGFMGMGVSLISIPYVGSVSQLIALVSLKSILCSATLPARQLLTVESEQPEGWQRGLANMQFLNGLGETLGMGIGAATVTSMGFAQLFLMCGVLCMLSATASGVLTREPGFMIQRRLVRLERSTSALIAVSNLVGYSGRLPRDRTSIRILSQLKSSTKFLMVGIFAFSLGGATLFSPLPAYFLQLYSSSAVFFLFFGGSLAGTLCYPIVGRLALSARKSLVLSSGARMVVIPLLLLSALGATPGLALGAAILAILEVLWTLFDISSMFAFLETAPDGQAGFYGALIGLGAAGGGFLGGFVAKQLGFASLFALCSVICAGALVAFVLQFRSSIRLQLE
jgi:predicted MFS family arabinose efflux permease